MSTLQVAEPVALWSESGKPVRLVWRGKRFRVTDTPTLIRETTGREGPMHPTERLIGWRFQGTSPDGEAHVFDLAANETGEWRLVAYFD